MDKPLFPCFVADNPQSKPLFPSAASADDQTAVVSQLPQCSSYKQQESIEISSDSSESSVELLTIERPTRKEKRKHKKEKKKRHKKRKKHDEDHSPKNETKHDSYLDYLPKGKAIFLDDIPNLRPEDAFRIDRRPDRNNLAFSKLYERFVPRYSSRDVLSTFRRERKRDPEKKQEIKRYFSKKFKSNPNIDFVYPKMNTFSEISNIDYIRIESRDFSVGLTENSVQDQKIQFDSLKNDGDTDKSMGPEYSSKAQLILALTKEFNRRLYEEKTNVDLWIDFIRFQDLVFHQESSQDALKRCVEKKLDICNKALEFNRKSVKLNLLRLKLLTLCSDELQKECSEVDAEWKSLCFLFPNAPQIWFDWIYYSLRCERILNFHANSRTKKIFKQAFGSLSKKLLEGQFQSHRIENKHLELTLVNLTLFLAECFCTIDQTEKAIGIFQALIEFNLFTPEKIDLENSFEEWFIMFEQFWDSGVSRIGEFSHLTDSGWGYFQSQLAKGEVETIKIKNEQNMKVFDTQELTDKSEDQIVSQIQESVVKENDKWIRSLCWLHLERLRHVLHWLPANVPLPIHHSLDDIDDPERIVLSDDDIKPFLYRLREDDSKFYLSIKFLQFLGVPLVTHALDSGFSSSYFEWEFTVETLFHHDLECSLDPIQKIFEISKKLKPRFRNLSEEFVLNRYGLEEIGDGNYGNKVPLCDDIVQQYDRIHSKSHQAFIENAFEKLCHHFQHNHEYRLYLYYIWAHYKIDLYHRKFIKEKSVKKFFKDIIEKTSDIENLSLYNIFCGFMAEIQNSPNIFMDTITNYEKLNPKAVSNILRIKLSFVRQSLDLDSCLYKFIKGEKLELKNSNDGILSVLVRHFQKGHPLSCKNAINLIKSLWIERNRKKMEEIQAIALMLFLDDKFEKTVDFLEQQLLPDSLGTIDFDTRFELDEQVKKLSMERSLYLLYLQLVVRQYNNPNSKNPISLARIRILIDRTLSSFPDDPVFLAVLARIETKFNVLTRSRKFFNDYVSNSANFIQNYMVKRYLNQIDDENEESNLVSMNSIYNIFMATLHSELLILDKATTNDDAGFDFHSGMANRIRNLFERALNCNDNGDRPINWLLGRSLAHCPTIWRLYFRFEEAERRRKEKCTGRKLNRNTSMIYRALQMCPNHKPLYLDAVILEPNMLQECIDIMVDKQLRVRTAIEEIDLLLTSASEQNSKDLQID